MIKKSKLSRFKKPLILIMTLLLIISAFPPIEAKAYINVVEDGIKLSNTNDYRIPEFSSSLKYKARENWNVVVDGTTKGQMVLFTPPGDDSNLGRTMAHKNTIRDWANGFGGNSNFVFEKILYESYTITRLNDGQLFNRYYSVDIAKYSGATVRPRSGLGGQGYLEVTTSPFPTITKLQAPTEVNQNTDFNVTFSGIEYNPHTSNVSYKLLVNGSPKASGSFSASDLGLYNNPGANGTITNITEKVQISGTGTYTVELLLTDGIERTSKKTTTINVKASAPKPIGKPYLEIEPSLQQIQVGETASYKAYYYDKDGKKTDVTTNTGSTWTSFSSATASLQSKGTFKGLKEGSLTVRVQYGGLQALAQLIVSNTPPPNPPVDKNNPPTVNIDGPTEVIAGQDFCLQANANDPDGDPLTYSWGYTGNGTLSGQSGCGLSYDTPGVERVTVTVNDGKDSASDDHYINVLPPQPKANFNVSGTLKENRKVNLNASHPYNGSASVLAKFPMTDEKWTVTALNTANQSAIKSVQSLSGNLSYSQVIDLLMKKPGDYKITRYVKNSIGLEDTVETTITIQPDLAPVADFSTVTLIYRDDVKETDTGTSKATIKASDMSYSRDDSIAKRIWKVTYDSNNDGSYTDETAEVLSDANLTEISFTTNKVGKYKIELEVFEQFEQPTIDQFVDITFAKATTDRRYHNTSIANPDKANAIKPVAQKVVEVENLAPTVSYDVKERKNINLEIAIGNTQYSQQTLEAKLNQVLNPKLNEMGYDFKTTYTKTGVGFDNTRDFSTSKSFEISYPSVAEQPKLHEYATWGYRPSLRVIPLTENRMLAVYAYTDNSMYWSSGHEVFESDGSRHGVKLRGITDLRRLLINPFNNHFYSFSQGTVINSPMMHLDEYDEYGDYVGRIEVNLGVSFQQLYMGSGDLSYSQDFTNSEYTFLDENTLITPMYDQSNANNSYLMKIDLEKKSVITKRSIPHGNVNFFDQNTYLYMELLSNRSFVYEMDTNTLNNTGTTKVTIPSRVFVGNKLGKDFIASMIIDGRYQNRLLKEDGTITTPLLGTHIRLGEHYLLLRDNEFSLMGKDYNQIKIGTSHPFEVDFEGRSAYSINDSAYMFKSRLYNTTSVYNAIGLKGITRPPKDETDFYISTVDKELLAEDVKALKDVRVNHIVLGTSSNKAQFMGILETEGNQGTFIDNTNIDSSIQELSDYILSQLGKKRVDLQIDITDSPFTEDQLKGALQTTRELQSENKISINPTFFKNSHSLLNKLSTSGDSVHIVTEKGEVISWGRSLEGQLGMGHQEVVVNLPTVNPHLKNIISAANAGYNTLYLNNMGEVFGTGNNIRGEVGNGTNLSNNYAKVLTPQKVKGLPYINYISMGRTSSGDGVSYAVDVNGDVWVWGQGSGGLFADGNGVTDSPIPKKISGLTNIKKVVAQYNQGLALNNDGEVFVYGYGSHESTITSLPNGYLTPTKLTGLPPVKDIEIDNFSTTFLLEDGRVMVGGAGYNQLAPLGRSSTFKDTGLTNIVDIESDSKNEWYTGYTRTFAINDVGEVFYYGRNDTYQLGNGETVDQFSRFTKLENLTDIVAISTQENYTTAINSLGEVFSFGRQMYPTKTYTIPTKVTTVNFAPQVELNGYKSTKNTLFTSTISNKKINEKIVTSTISTLNSYYIGVGNSENKTNMQSIINKNANGGLFLEHGSEPNELMKGIAEYIILQMQEDKVDLVFDIGDTVHNDKTIIESKVNSIVVPKLNQEGISLSSLNIRNNLKQSYIADINAGTVNSYNNYIKTLGVRFTSSKDVVLKDFSVVKHSKEGMVEYGLWNEYGERLGSGTYDTNVDSYTVNLKFERDIPLKKSVKYYIGFYKQQNGAPIAASLSTFQQYSESIKTINNNTFSFRGAVWESGKPPITGSDSGGYGIPQIALNISEGISYGELEKTSYNTFVSYLEDKPLDDTRINDLSINSLLNNAHSVGLGNSSNKNDFNTIIKKNMDKGTFINNVTIDSSLNELANYIIEEVNKKRGTKELYITLDEEVKYFTAYNDYEKDPKMKDRWKYDQVETVFENDMGKDSRHMKEMETPIEQFAKVGRYQPYYSAKDDPLIDFPVSYQSLFEPYRKWAKDADNWFIYVHRKPVPEFTFTINGTTGDYTINNAAYDLDKESIEIGFGPGLKSQAFQWRVKGETTWKDGVPASPLERKVYEVKNTVVDFQKREESLIKLFDATGVNKPPIAKFDPVPNTIAPLEDTQLQNSSYDPNGDDMTAKWYWKVKEQDDTKYNEFATGGAWTNNTANPNWNPFKNFLAEGEYTFKLVVTDKLGLSDSTTQDVLVLPDNTGPVACMKIPTPNYIGDTIVIENCSTDEDGDPLTYTYTVKKQNGGTDVIQTGDSRIDADGNLTLVADQHPTDLGVWDIKQEVNDGTETAMSEGKLTVLDQIVKGNVQHTAKWLDNLTKFNAAYPSRAYNLDPANGLVEFLPGEKFVLKGSETEKAVQINVHIKEHPLVYNKVGLTEGAPNIWDGSMWKSDMIERFKDGEVLTFVFTATFQNGWIDTDEVQVRMKNDPYWKQHTTF